MIAGIEGVIAGILEEASGVIAGILEEAACGCALAARW